MVLILRILLWTFLSLMILTGCTEKQQQGIDRAADKATDVTETAKDVIESPAGRFIPPDIKFWAVLGIAAIEAGVCAWQRSRGQAMKKTARAIVKGIEKVAESQAPDVIGPVKDAIGKQMRSAEIYDQGNKIVDALKIS